jgi:hypothetical protein
MNPEFATNSLPVASDISDVPLAPDMSGTQTCGSRDNQTTGDDRLDWDTCIPSAPRRPSGWIKVGLDYGGRGTPTAVDDPWA